MKPVRLLITGASSTPTCGVRDQAAALEPALQVAGAATESLWWERDAAWSWRDTRRSAARFLARLRERLAGADHDAVVWHYSVFDYGPRTAWDLRGLPVFSATFARTLAQGIGPLVVVLHECAYSWSERGWQRKGLAAGQRAALFSVVHAGTGLVLASEPRERWLRERRWLPSRPLVRIPVCATLQPLSASERPAPDTAALRVGVFGFGADDAQPEIVVRAIGALRERGHDVRLVLLGAPGSRGERAERWRRAARDGGCGPALTFSGLLSSKHLARELAAVDVVVFPHSSGCGAGKTTLASALAFAKPAIAFDGPQRWDKAIDEGALLIVAAPSAAVLAGRLGELLGDEPQRARQAERGHAFFQREMDPMIGAGRLLAFVDQL